MEYKGLWQHIEFENFEEYILIQHGNFTKEEVKEIRKNEQKLPKKEFKQSSEKKKKSQHSSPKKKQIFKP